MQKEKQIFFNRYYAWCISARNCRFSARKVIDVMDGNLNCLQFHSSKRYPLTSSKFARVLSIFLFFFLEGSLFFNRLKILVFRVNYHVLQCYPGITLTRDHCCSPFLSLCLSFFHLWTFYYQRIVANHVGVFVQQRENQNKKEEKSEKNEEKKSRITVTWLGKRAEMILNQRRRFLDRWLFNCTAR